MDKFVIISNSTTLDGLGFSGLNNNQHKVLIYAPHEIEKEEFLNILKGVLQNKNLETVFISEPFYNLVKEEISSMKDFDVSICSIPIRF